MLLTRRSFFAIWASSPSTASTACKDCSTLGFLKDNTAICQLKSNYIQVRKIDWSPAESEFRTLKQELSISHNGQTTPTFTRLSFTDVQIDSDQWTSPFGGSSLFRHKRVLTKPKAYNYAYGQSRSSYIIYVMYIIIYVNISTFFKTMPSLIINVSHMEDSYIYQLYIDRQYSSLTVKVGFHRGMGRHGAFIQFHSQLSVWIYRTIGMYTTLYTPMLSTFSTILCHIPENQFLTS